VPMLIIQPFVENAIWHGFHSRQPNAKLNIQIYASETEVEFMVEDNGELNSNIENTTVLPGKKMSMGSSIVSDQIKAIKELAKREASYSSEPIQNEKGIHCGTKTVVKLPYIPLN
jgi:LytS/YehU family sensor histidine kinase